MLIAVVSVRAAIGLIFLLSSAGKMRDISGFIRGVQAYRLLPSGLAALYAAVLIPLEVVIGGLLLTGQLVVFAASLAIFALCSFFIGVAYALHQRADMPCYCFGADSSEHLSTKTLLRIALLTAGSVFVLVNEVIHGPQSSPATDATSYWAGIALSVTIGIAIVISLHWFATAFQFVRSRDQTAR